jgi:hypothetical protein
MSVPVVAVLGVDANLAVQDVALSPEPVLLDLELPLLMAGKMPMPSCSGKIGPRPDTDTVSVLRFTSSGGGAG